MQVFLIFTASDKCLHRRRTSCCVVIMFCVALACSVLASSAQAQTVNPLTNAEFVNLLNKLPARPEMLETVITEVRQRGIAFELTNALRSLVASRSKGDAVLRRTLLEAERRRLNPSIAATLPTESESRALLEQARIAALAAAKAMPDFLVNQQISRSYALGESRNWIPSDRLTVLVTYREGLGERYKLLRKNDVPVATDERERGSYAQSQGTSSTGEFASNLELLFQEESRAEFKAVDTDELRGHRTIVYEFEIKQPNSKYRITSGGGVGDFKSSESVVVGYQGRVWIDRETYRVLRLESAARDIPAEFPVSAAFNRVDYDWTTIDAKQYLLPLRAEVELTSRRSPQPYQTRNDIRFRSYRKFGSKVEIIEDDEVENQ